MITGRLQDSLLAVAWLLLAATAAAKLVALSQPTAAMQQLDPVFGISVRATMLCGVGLEAAACAALLAFRDTFTSGLVLAGLGAQFLLYHAARLAIAPHGLCPCLGSAWKWLGLTEAGATTLAMVMALFITAAGVLLMRAHGPRIEKT